ncbi:hypothetical protein [Caballeronia sp. SL2Y3]|uniref:hypothetical protein n=1 Tax=Caballeronia sp. SL2Y3 TaxID=2878151 RepID=UPI001FD0481A|nr:hypothetical protein [Caballeronia sp. SL2Y3]
MMTPRTSTLLRRAALGGIFMIGSVIGGVWLTRAIVIREDEMPYWMDVATRRLLAAFGANDPPIEDIIDTSLLATFLLCWMVASIGMLCLWRVAKWWRATQHR